MASTEKLIRITLQLDNQLSKGLKEASSGLDKMASTMKKTGAAMTVGLTLPIVAMGAVATKTAIEFESAFAGVIKTVDGTEEQLQSLRGELEMLATSGESPVSSLENAQVALFEIAEAAGQLGVAREDIVGFTETLAALSMATDIVGDEGARSLAQFANAAQFDLGNIDKLGDVIVDLGNNLATTENQILTFGQRMGTLSQIGFEAEELLAFGGAMASIGINAEAGSTAFVAGAQKIAVAAAQGGEKLATLADVTGMTQSAFASMFDSDPASAMQEFIEGLSTMELVDQVAALDSLGIKGVRARAAFLGLAGDTEGLANALTLAGDAIQGNGALMDEAGKRAETTAGQINLFKNNMSQLAAEFGAVIMPALNSFLGFIIPIVQWLASLDEGTKTLIVGILALVAALGPLLMFFGAIASALSAIVAIAPLMAAAWVMITGPIGLIALVVVGAIAALWLLVANWQQISGLLAVTGQLIMASFQAFGAWLMSWIPEIGGFLTLLGDMFTIRFSNMVSGAALFSQRMGEELAKTNEVIKTSTSQWGTNFKLGGEIMNKTGKRVIEIMRGLGNQIKIILQALVPIMKTVAIQIMSGLIEGIKSKITEWINVLKGMVDNTVNMVRNAFDIRSPSKVMAKLGEQVGAGFTAGVEAVGGIGVNVPQINGGSVGSPSLSTAGATGGGGGSGNVYINTINVPVGTTREQIEHIMREIGKASKKLGARNF